MWNHWTADPEALTDAEFGRHQPYVIGEWDWYELAGDFDWASYEKDILDLIVDDTAVDWLGSSDGVNWAAHTFSPDHVYRYEWTGHGQSVSFMIADHIPFGSDYYGDNSGSLTVSIYTLPEPMTLGMLAVGWLFVMRRRGSAGRRPQLVPW